MSIRKKLLISNFGMVFIPLFLFFVAAVLLLGLFQRDLAGIVIVKDGVPAFASSLLTGIEAEALERAANGGRSRGPHGPFGVVEAGGKRYAVDRLALNVPDGGGGTDQGRRSRPGAWSGRAAQGQIRRAGLVMHPNRVFSKDELFQNIWGFDSLGDIATVTVHISKLREKIESVPSKPQYIETIWGVGYRFNV